MKKTQNNLVLVSMLFVVALVVSNVVTVKLIQTGLTLGGIAVLLPGAALAYSVTFLMSDVVAEIWGKAQAKTLVVFGIIGQLVASVIILLTQFLPAVDPDMQAAYETVLGMNYIFVVSSLLAYFTSQMWDVHIFHKIRSAWLAKHNSRKQRWIWNNLSTASSQFIDTLMFIGFAFGIGFGWLFDTTMLPLLLVMVVGQYFFKLFVAILDTPLFYLLTRDSKE